MAMLSSPTAEATPPARIRQQAPDAGCKNMSALGQEHDEHMSAK